MPLAAPPAAPPADRLEQVREALDPTVYARPLGPAVRAVTQAVVLYLAPVVALAVTDRWWLVAPLWVLAGLGVAGLFVIGHDASHGALLGSPKANRIVAQVLMGPSLHVEAAWDLGHNRIHHGYTTRQGFDFVWHPVTVEEYRAMSRWARARHRLEWSPLGSGAYYLRAVWWSKMWAFNPPGKRRAAILRDKAELTAGAGGVGAAVALVAVLSDGPLAAAWLVVKLFVVPFLIFIQIIGWTVYVHHVGPDIRWWSRRNWTPFHGQMDSTTVMATPRVVNRLWFHNIFVHVPHHVDARIRFDHLEQAAAQITARYPGIVHTTGLSIGSYLRTTRACKLYDFERGCWLTYGAARQEA